MNCLLPITRGVNPPRVIFCDWHGVLCSKPYWHSIIEDPGHPYQRVLSDHLGTLFTTGNVEGREWMCGMRSSRAVIANLTRSHPGLDAEQLLRLLAADIAAMPVDPDLLSALLQARTETTIVLATDNIDVFASTARAHAHTPAGRGTAVPTLATSGGTFHDVLSSSDLGVLKSQHPQDFFGPWLRQHGIAFSDALLLDDRPDNCAAFEACAGRAVLWPTPMRS